MKRTWACAAFAILLAALSCRPKQVVPKQAADPFPLSKGAYWVYKGPTKWSASGAAEPRQAVLTWRMEVTGVMPREAVTGFVLKGFPGDLAWYEEGKQPAEYLLVRVGTGSYYLLSDARMAEVEKRLKNPEDFLEGLLRDSELLLDLPLAEGKIFGETAQVTRADGSYCWAVESSAQVDPARRKALRAPEDSLEYTLRFQSRPDHQVMRFVPGVGITGYRYVHHGTVSETDLTLVEWGGGEFHSRGAEGPRE